MTLNISVLLRANADQLEGELGQAKDALRGLGTEARSTGGAMSSGLAQGSGALDRLRGLATTVRGSFGVAKNSLAQLALQAQDVAVGLGSGQSPFTVLAQQGSQIASIFGPGGAIVGAVLAAGGVITKLFLDVGDGIGSAERAANSFKTAMDGVGDTVGKSVIEAGKLTAAYQDMAAGARQLELLRLARETREHTTALRDQGKALDGLLEQLEAASSARLGVALFSSGRAAGLGGLAGELTRDQAQSIRELVERFRGGAIDASALAEGLQRLGESGEALQGLTDKALDSAIAAHDLRAELEQLGAARSSLESLSSGADQELSRLEGMLQRIDQAVDTTSMSFRDLYMDVVGGSYVPDMVTEASSWFDRLEQDMTTKTEAATSTVSEAFAGLDRQVSYRLGSMVAHGKTTLQDFADFTQDILGQILGSLISAGINAGIGGLFSPTPTPAPAGGGGGAFVTPEVLHRGGIAGAAGNPRRQVPWSAFDDAPRYHRGVLRAGEVPAILQRGERVTPAGQSGGMTVNIVDQRSGGEKVTTRDRSGPGGERMLDVFIRDKVNNMAARGDLDTSLNARYGIRPAVRPR